jgi:hypothetical protein
MSPIISPACLTDLLRLVEDDTRPGAVPDCVRCVSGAVYLLATVVRWRIFAGFP